MPERIDHTGSRFGMLAVVGFSHTNRHKQAVWLVRCDCGAEKGVLAQSLTSGNSTSCGSCSHQTHGETRGGKRTPEWISWQHAKDRCFNPRSHAWRLYGGRGVTMCREWADSYEQFLADMGRRPTLEHTLDRIDPYGDYEPGNCRWADKQTQTENRRRKGVPA